MESKLSANLSTNDKARPISMVTYDIKSGKFIVNPEAESIIRNLPSPLGVISVAGMYRTGKSYLLNRVLLNQSNGLQLTKIIIMIIK